MLLVASATACRTVAPPPAEPGPLAGLAAADLDSQRLYRVEARGPEGRSTLRLVLRLWRPDRFQATASDALGRALWSLEVAGDRARWRDPRSGESCSLSADEPLALPRFSLPLASRELPAVLLGRLPAAAAGAAAVGAGAVGGEWRDPQGRRGTFAARDGQLVEWRLADGGVEVARWRRDDAGVELRLDGGRIALVWREAARERLRSPPPPWRERDDEPECADAPLS